jgi:predicted CXXCH cytochrome family protein
LNHPVGITPTGPVPTNMPLDSRSRITCLTCHDRATSAGNLRDADSKEERFLRRPRGIEFCGTCHMKMSGTMSEQSHWRLSAHAHLGSINPQATASEETKLFAGGIDTESRMCLSCHEDITVTIPSLYETNRQKRARWKRMSDHPIGMDYQHAATRKSGRYKYPLIGQNRIRLFAGKLGCGSCHSPYSRLKKNLVMSNLRSALCLTCHNL